jgi:hypothetical protein
MKLGILSEIVSSLAEKMLSPGREQPLGYVIIFLEGPVPCF